MLQTSLDRLRIIPMPLLGSQACLRTSLRPRGASFLFQRCFQRPVKLVFGLTRSLLRTRFRLAIRLRVISVLGCATPRVASCIARLAIMLSRDPAVTFRPRTVLPSQAAVLILFGTPVPLLLPVMICFPLSGGHHRPRVADRRLPVPQLGPQLLLQKRLRRCRVADRRLPALQPHFLL
jgi:hypothetical protein